MEADPFNRLFPDHGGSQSLEQVPPLGSASCAPVREEHSLATLERTLFNHLRGCKTAILQASGTTEDGDRIPGLRHDLHLLVFHDDRSGAVRQEQGSRTLAADQSGAPVRRIVAASGVLPETARQHQRRVHRQTIARRSCVPVIRQGQAGHGPRLLQRRQHQRAVPEALQVPDRRPEVPAPGEIGARRGPRSHADTGALSFRVQAQLLFNVN